MQYRALRVRDQKIIEGPMFFDANSDEAAIAHAKEKLTKPGVLQVWEGPRFIINLRESDA